MPRHGPRRPDRFEGAERELNASCTRTAAAPLLSGLPDSDCAPRRYACAHGGGCRSAAYGRNSAPGAGGERRKNLRGFKGRGGGRAGAIGFLRGTLWEGATESAILAVLRRELRGAALGAEAVPAACPVGGCREGRRPGSRGAAVTEGAGFPPRAGRVSPLLGSPALSEPLRGSRPRPPRAAGLPLVLPSAALPVTLLRGSRARSLPGRLPDAAARLPAWPVLLGRHPAAPSCGLLAGGTCFLSGRALRWLRAELLLCGGGIGPASGLPACGAHPHLSSTGNRCATARCQC